MNNRISFLPLINWLKSSEMFARPSRQIPGKWQLTEYYTETEFELRNMTGSQLKAAGEFWDIEFKSGKVYLQNGNIPVPVISGIKNGNWFISKNFITLTSSGDSVQNVEFQFAIENEMLKMLKKNTLGRIDFFGFFKKLE